MALLMRESVAWQKKNDKNSRKLRTTNNQPIDLGLIYIYRLIIKEMRGLAHCIYIITFSIIYSDNL